MVDVLLRRFRLVRNDVNDYRIVRSRTCGRLSAYANRDRRSRGFHHRNLQRRVKLQPIIEDPKRVVKTILKRNSVCWSQCTTRKEWNYGRIVDVYRDSTPLVRIIAGR